MIQPLGLHRRIPSFTRLLRFYDTAPIARYARRLPRYARRSPDTLDDPRKTLRASQHLSTSQNTSSAHVPHIHRPLGTSLGLWHHGQTSRTLSIAHRIVFPFIFVCFDTVRLLVPLRSVVPAPPSHPLSSRLVCFVCHILSSSSILCVFVFEPLNVL